jgi:hypothetical protein
MSQQCLPMEDDAEADAGSPQSQSEAAAEQMSHWLDVFDENFTLEEVPLSQRPLRALTSLFVEGAMEVRVGDDLLDTSKPHEHAQTLWFRVLYQAVQHWYVERFGAAAMKGKGVPPLDGAVLIRNVAFPLVVPANRRKIEVEGEQAWIYFDDRIGPEEEPASWISNTPDLARLSYEDREQVLADAREVSNTLRSVEFRRVTSSIGDDQDARKLVAATSTYLQQAARRIVSGKTQERGPAWFDLQMANETALKAVLCHATGKAPHIHNLPKLLAAAVATGVNLNLDLFEDWPDFKTMSDWRYGQGDPWGLEWLYVSYRLTLKVARGAMAQMPTGLTPGFGILLQYPPWQRKE